MKVFKTLSVGILTSGLLLGATACSPESVSSPVENIVHDEAQEKSDVAQTVNDFFGYITDKDHARAMSELAKRDYDAFNDDQIAEIVTSHMPAGFEYFDVSDSKQTLNAYAFMSTLAYRTYKSEDFSMFTVPGAVSIDGNKATVDGSRIDTVYNGVRRDNVLSKTTAQDNLIHMVRVDGKWLIKAPSIDFRTGEPVQTE